jgi:glycosyltransferase involved in cell wall biosynthesis
VETVCHVITKLELGGAQEVALYAVSNLDRTRFRPVLVAGPGGMLTEEARRLPGVQTIIIPSLGCRIHAMSDLFALFALVALFRRLRPTIVHTHSSKAGILGRWAAWLARVPVIIHTVHGFGITPAQSKWLQRWLVLLERMTGWITTHWITVAQVDAKKGRRWRLFEQNVSVIRAGIDPRPFQLPIQPVLRDRLREEFGAGPDAQLIGTVACLKPQKAPEDFVLVAKRVCEVMPQARFVLIGDGELRPRIEELIQQHRLLGRVRLTGWRRDIDMAMKAFDVLLLTSHWEGLPRVILEASAAGLPIVATKVGGVDEAVTHGPAVRLCEAGDIEGLAAGLGEILQRRGKGVGGPQENREALPKEFHIEEMVKQYQSLYDRLLLEHRVQSMPNSLGPASQP